MNRNAWLPASDALASMPDRSILSPCASEKSELVGDAARQAALRRRGKLERVGACLAVEDVLAGAAFERVGADAA